jgi:hypothetical protein
MEIPKYSFDGNGLRWDQSYLNQISKKAYLLSAHELLRFVNFSTYKNIDDIPFLKKQLSVLRTCNIENITITGFGNIAFVSVYCKSKVIRNEAEDLLKDRLDEKREYEEYIMNDLERISILSPFLVTTIIELSKKISVEPSEILAQMADCGVFIPYLYSCGFDSEICLLVIDKIREEPGRMKVFDSFVNSVDKKEKIKELLEMMP